MMKELIDFLIEPNQLGFRISVVDRPMFGCPFCFSNVKMAVYEHGIQWACGCARMLPDLHVTSGKNCWRCKKIGKKTIPFRPQVRIACIDRLKKLSA